MSDYHIGLCELCKNRRHIKKTLFPGGTFEACTECKAISDRIEARKQAEREDDKDTLLIALACAAFALFLFASSCHAQGVERWPVKTLNDGFHPHPAVRSTIEAERALKPPHWTTTLPRQPLETVTIEISGKLIACGGESDSDLHCIESDGKNTMIFECPKPEFVAPEYRKQVSTVREWLYAHAKFGKITVLAKPIPCTFTAVRFFDRPHGLDHAPNGVEGHLILAVK